MEKVGERENAQYNSHEFIFQYVADKIFLNDVSHESLIWEIRKSQIQMIQIFMNINRIINKYIISKYVKRENKPG